MGINTKFEKVGPAVANKIGAVSAQTQVTPPPGGTGATEGAYDTAANRDLMIVSLTAAKDDVANLISEVTFIRAAINALIDEMAEVKAALNAGEKV